MKTLSILSASNNNAYTLLQLNDKHTYAINDHIFIYDNILDNTGLESRDPFAADNIGYKILDIDTINNTVTIKKAWDSAYNAITSGFLTNICINNSYLYTPKNGSYIDIKDGLLINNNVIGNNNNETLDESINTFNIWNGYIDNSIINIGNLGKGSIYNTIESAFNYNNNVTIFNSLIGKNNLNLNVYCTNTTTINCTFGIVQFNGGNHYSTIDNPVTIDYAIVNNGNFYDVVFDYIIMNNGNIGTSDITNKIIFTSNNVNYISGPILPYDISFDNTITPTEILLLNYSSDSRLNVNTKNMLFNYGNIINDLYEPNEMFKPNDYTGIPLNFTDYSATITATFEPTWFVPTLDQSSTGVSFLSINQIKKGIINGGNIKYTALGDDTESIVIKNATILSSYINNAFISNITILSDDVNLPLISNNSIIKNQDLVNTKISNSIIDCYTYASSLINCVTYNNITSSRLIDNMFVSGIYKNNYSEMLRINTMDYMFGIVPDIINAGYNMLPPGNIFDSLTTDAQITLSDEPIITLNLTELIVSGISTLPTLGDYLKIDLTKSSSAYSFYLYVSQDILDYITDLNTAYDNSDTRPVKTINIKGITPNSDIIDYSGCTINVSLYTDFSISTATTFTFDIGFKDSYGNYHYPANGGSLPARFSPYTPCFKLTIDPVYPFTNAVPGVGVYIQIANLEKNGDNIFFVTQPSTPTPGTGQFEPDENVEYYLIDKSVYEYLIGDIAGSHIATYYRPGDTITDFSVTLQYKQKIGFSYTTESITKVINIV